MKEVYKLEGHKLVPLFKTGKSFCYSCGLIALNNDVSRWCLDKGCNYKDHPAYGATIKRLTKRK